MKKIDPAKLPRHIAIIMDGNGRWAKKNALRRIAGHRAGVKAVRTVVTACREMGIRYLTLYAFSVENWLRPQKEVNALMTLLGEYLEKELPTMLKNNIRLTTIGNVDVLPQKVREILIDSIEETSRNNGMVLNLALSYSGRDEIVRAVRKIMRDAGEKSFDPDEITMQTFSGYLDTSGIPDPDLLIRTSGEYRLSNFLLWQTAYTEFYFTDVLWPDFSRQDLNKAILDYQKRERRFGLTSDQLPKD
ncbi:MAG: isoprenyl transferase [Syntrophales bacterium]